MKKIVSVLLIVLIAFSFISCTENKPTEAGYSGPYIANTSTGKFHKDSCSYLPDPVNRATYQTRQAAVDAGYSPCGHCKP